MPAYRKITCTSEKKYSNEFRGENRVVLESKEIANHFNKFFVDIGTNL